MLQVVEVASGTVIKTFPGVSWDCERWSRCRALPGRHACAVLAAFAACTLLSSPVALSKEHQTLEAQGPRPRLSCCLPPAAHCFCCCALPAGL